MKKAVVNRYFSEKKMNSKETSDLVFGLRVTRSNPPPHYSDIGKPNVTAGEEIENPDSERFVTLTTFDNSDFAENTELSVLVPKPDLKMTDDDIRIIIAQYESQRQAEEQQKAVLGMLEPINDFVNSEYIPRKFRESRRLRPEREKRDAMKEGSCIDNDECKGHLNAKLIGKYKYLQEYSCPRGERSVSGEVIKDSEAHAEESQNEHVEASKSDGLNIMPPWIVIKYKIEL